MQTLYIHEIDPLHSDFCSLPFKITSLISKYILKVLLMTPTPPKILNKTYFLGSFLSWLSSSVYTPIIKCCCYSFTLTFLLELKAHTTERL